MGNRKPASGRDVHVSFCFPTVSHAGLGPAELCLGAAPSCEGEEERTRCLLMEKWRDVLNRAGRAPRLRHTYICTSAWRYEEDCRTQCNTQPSARIDVRREQNRGKASTLRLCLSLFLHYYNQLRWFTPACLSYSINNITLWHFVLLCGGGGVLSDNERLNTHPSHIRPFSTCLFWTHRRHAPWAELMVWSRTLCNNEATPGNGSV